MGKTRSWVWDYATRDGSKAYCNLCTIGARNELSCPGGTTGSLGRHLSRVHGVKLVHDNHKRRTIVPPTSPYVKNENTILEQDKILPHCNNWNLSESPTNDTQHSNTGSSITPSTASAAPFASREMHRLDLARAEDQFVKFIQSMQYIFEQRFLRLAVPPPPLQDDCDGFFGMVREKLNKLPEAAREDAKMFYLNYLHEKIRTECN